MPGSKLKASKRTTITGTSAPEVMSLIDRGLEHIRPSLPRDAAMAKAILLLQSGKGKRLVEKLADESREIFEQLEGGKWVDSAYQNRMAPLIAIMALLIEEEERLQNVGRSTPKVKLRRFRYRARHALGI
jgi:hypothetical protein